jgi:hypothetical protein
MQVGAFLAGNRAFSPGSRFVGGEPLRVARVVLEAEPVREKHAD